ncbi:hypothetical protein V7S43_012780 [Phytophthora oleae]|uniref:Uncharacterized protein n=1 Tax=Phytophthora oleae TaxID=2107226 RepID=A0ABD3F5I0_9STRA
MSLLPSAVKTPISSEVSSSGVKIKRKSRHHRTSPAEEPERQMEVEAPRERSHHSRGIEASKPNRNRRSSTLTSSGEGTSRRTPSYSSNRHSNGTPSLASKRRSEQPSVALHATISTRRTLTSSASSIRPSNRKRIEESPYRSGGHQRSSGNNNNSGLEEVNQHFYKQEDWLPSSNNQTSRVTLPSRASKYRNLSAGVVKKPRVRPTAAPASKELPDRPPSRQRHAFPTHLTDANAFDAPETTRKREGSFSSCSSTSSARSCERRASAVDSTSPEGVTDRPPSRYMVKAKRNSTQTLRQDPNALSRRGVVEKNMSFSCNQTHHDPKTDGFADVDESVPPPFRIKVTTDASETTPRLKTTRDPLSARHWPFSNQEQLLQMAVRGSDGSRSSDQAMTDLQSQLQWFGKDDQINNAHLFETIITLPSPRPTLEPEVVTIEDDPEDSFGPEFQSWKVVTKEPQNEPQHVENHFPSRRAAAASKTADALPVSDQPDQWIRSSTNPFFVEPSPTVDFDSMDPETAIEQTPLYSAEDLMTFTATEMTDLHLDDYTAASIPAPPPSSGGWSSRLLSASGSLPLRTSLGKDFLSLFAQH